MRQTLILAALTTLTLAGSLTLAQAPPTEDAELAAAPTIDPADLEAYLDGLIRGRMESHHVVGVTISVVYGGEVVLAKGYGHADLAAGRPVVASEALFRPGSISKTFTWTAVMQLHEQGKLDLDADVNDYLEEVEVPATFPEPITLRHLMAHTPGFEDSALGHLFVDDAEEALPLVEYLKTHQPARVRPPGVTPAYSNYGTALAGLIVANVSGQRFEDYVDEHILAPLGMTRSTFREPWAAQQPDPMPAELESRSSKGYLRKDGGYVEGVFEFISPLGPAGALSTTATDMARYMLMHLGEGSYDGVQILAPETARLMHSQHWTPDPVMTGLAHGFIEADVNGYRAYGHGGGTLYFLSDLVMVPELDFGLFVSTNTATGFELIDQLPQLVVGRYFPDKAGPAPAPPSDFAERGARFAGTYVATRRAYTTVEKLLMMPQLALNVSTSDDGYLVTSLGGDSERWVEIAPLTFRQAEGSAVVKFSEDESGKITGVPFYMPIMTFEKVGALGNPNLLLGIVGLALLVFVGVLVGAWLRRRRDVAQSHGERWASVTTLLMATLWLIFAILLGVSAAGMLDDIPSAMFDFPDPAFVAALTVAVVAALATVVATFLLYPVWRQGSWPRWRRLRHTLVVALALATALILHNFNAIGYHYF